MTDLSHNVKMWNYYRLVFKNVAIKAFEVLTDVIWESVRFIHFSCTILANKVIVKQESKHVSFLCLLKNNNCILSHKINLWVLNLSIWKHTLWNTQYNEYTSGKRITMCDMCIGFLFAIFNHYITFLVNVNGKQYY